MSSNAGKSSSRRGGQGTVQAGHLHGELVACKCIPLSSKRAIAAETCSARRVGQRHAHIVGIKQSEKTATHIQMYMELGMCDLHDFQGCTVTPRLGEPVFVREWCLQLADALHFSHSQGVAHRDVKPENVLLFPHPQCDTICPSMKMVSSTTAPVTQVQTYQHQKVCLQQLAASSTSPQAAADLRAFVVKLCDFGAALVNTDGPGGSAVGITPRGTSRFCSPQVMSGLLNRGVTPGLTTLWKPVVHPDIVRTCAASYDAYAADVWSFGVTLFALASGSEPFQAAGPQCDAFRAFVRATQPHVLQDEIMCPSSDVWAQDIALGAACATWAWPESFSPALTHLLERCLLVREDDRPSMEQVVTHPWFKNPHWVPLPRMVHAPLSPARINSLSDLEELVQPPLHPPACAALYHASPVPPLRALHNSGSTADSAFTSQCRSARLAFLGTSDSEQQKLCPGSAVAGDRYTRGGRKLVLSPRGAAVGSGSSEPGPRVVFHRNLGGGGSAEGDPLAAGLSLEGGQGGDSLNSIMVHGSREHSESNDLVLA